jgi:dihydrodipicolinate synthase/N-acetylneuraminate lyase
MQVAMPGSRFGGVYAATTTPLRADGSVDFDRYREHCTWLVDEGVAGIIPNGSLGEYETFTDDERTGLVAAAVAAVGGRADVVPGVSGKSAAEASRWAEQARAAGAPAVMALPPTSHKPTDDEVVAHFTEIGKIGLPIIAYNNPFSTRVDLTPPLLARLADEVEMVVAVKEFSQDARRVWQIRESAPRLEVLCGCDDTFVESMLAGAVGWIAGFVNAFPAQSVRLYRLCQAGDYAAAADLYRKMLPILRWDADPLFVQAIKLGQEEAGRYGGPVRLPRLALSDDVAAVVRAAARDALDAGY